MDTLCPFGPGNPGTPGPPRLPYNRNGSGLYVRVQHDKECSLFRAKIIFDTMRAFEVF